MFIKVSHADIANYLSAIRAKRSNFGFDISLFQDSRVRVFTKAIRKHSPINPHIKLVSNIPTLALLVHQCDRMHIGTVFKAAVLLSFFSFLKTSNLVPHSISSFDPLKQLTREDIIFSPPGAVVIIKWSKTLQFRDKIKLLKIPSLGSSELCPVAALKALLDSPLQGKMSPYFRSSVVANGFPYMMRD